MIFAPVFFVTTPTTAKKPDTVRVPDIPAPTTTVFS